MGAPSIDHVAVQVPDFDWCLDFFVSILGMEITLIDPVSEEKPWNQAWVGGIQLQRSNDGDIDPSDTNTDVAKEKRLSDEDGYTISPTITHIGIAADNAQVLLDKIYALDNIHQAPGKDRNWFVLPDGITIELLTRE